MSRIKDFFQRTVRALKPVSLGGGKPKVLYDISNTAGAPGSIGRRIVRQRVLPAMHVQVGTRNGLPVMKTVQVHRFLHATKGWREYHNGMPFANAPAFRGLPRNPAPLGKAHRVNVKQPGITVENKKNAKRVVLGWREMKRAA